MKRLITMVRPKYLILIRDHSSPDDIVKIFDKLKASMHDIHVLNDVQAKLEHCVLVGDKGHLSQQWQDDLFQHSAINL